MVFLRALRVELAVLLRWRVAWCLIIAMPLVIVVAQLSLVIALLSNPPNLISDPGGSGTYLLTLSSVMAIVFGLSGYGAILAMTIGAVVVAADWERGTIVFARLTGSGRVPLALARIVSIWMLLVMSSILTIVAVGAVCTLSGAVWPQWFIAGQRSLPPIGVLVHGVEVLAFTNIAYGSLGITAGSITRRVGPAVAVSIVFVLGVEQLLLGLGADVSGIFAFLYQHTPDAAATTLMAPFGVPGGGGLEPPTSAAVAHATLWLCTLGFAAIAALIECGIDSGQKPGRTQMALRQVAPTLPAFVSPFRSQRPWSVGVAIRTELSVIRHWPGVIALAAVFPIWTVMHEYAIPYGLYVEKAVYAAPGQVVPWLLPHHVLDVVLDSFDPAGGDPLGAAALVLIGAWLAASSWGNTKILSVTLTQAQRRMHVVTGQIAAAILVAAASALSALLLGVIVSELLRLAVVGNSSLPSLSHFAAGIGEAVLIAAAYVTIGWGIGFLTKSVGLSMMIVLGWVVIVQPLLIESTGTVLHGTLRSIFNALPGTLTSRLAYAQGVDGSMIGTHGEPTPHSLSVPTASWLLCAYVLFIVAVVAVLAARRDVQGSST